MFILAQLSAGWLAASTILLSSTTDCVRRRVHHGYFSLLSPSLPTAYNSVTKPLGKERAETNVLPYLYPFGLQATGGTDFLRMPEKHLPCGMITGPKNYFERLKADKIILPPPNFSCPI
ncbi:hypothetical protein AVEN_106682-1 [Araneus ventricosus]|uniref:Uncharacterized protein n=1 Tax=Araneus ventricosus TaxID=182803 RepID=A0A4Y2KF51_ARAVE|nr:hypothetical protein AVEN_106682-1 [Araneus ventricosus]